MIGSYLGATLILFLLPNFWVALFVVPIVVGFLGGLIEFFTIRPLYKRQHAFQLLLTFGYVILISDLILLIWGGDRYSIPPPYLFRGSLHILGITYPIYRIFILFFSIGLITLLWWLLEGTKLGAIIRAGTHDSEMLNAMGINIKLLFTLLFAFGSALAGLCGVISGPIYEIKPGMDISFIIDIFIVVVIGGMGSFKGSVLGGFIIGIAEVMTSTFLPDLGMVIVYIVAISLLFIFPHGIFGKREMHEIVK
jgi:branched-subunit amino acid ABC-type transport system permease component